MRFVTASGKGEDGRGRTHPAGTGWYRWDGPGATPTREAFTTDVPSPSFHAYANARRLLFTTTESEAEGRVSLNADGGASNMPSGGQGAVHADIDATGGFIAVANYRGEPRGDDLSVAVFPFDALGRLGAMAGRARHAGHGPDPRRQASPHTHCVVFSPDNRLLVAVDLGTDGAWFYRFDGASGAIDLVGEVKLTPGSGPRHCAFHPSRPFLYVCGELDSSLMTLRYDAGAGTAELVDRDDATRAPHAGRNYPSGIAISPDGHYVLVANRGADTIATFWIDPDTGHARLRDEIACGGKFPRSIRLDRTGRWLAVANQKSGNVCLFGRDFQTSRIEAVAAVTVELPAAMDVIFLDQ